jgi:pectate lyase|tara:strand:- start:10 stop:294 length:285 start_codon:yes stop_codon:yes gene_type:complete
MASLTTPVTLLSAVTATGASQAVQADAGQPAFLQVSGITSATVALQGSLDGSNWSTIGTALTANGIITIANAPTYLRANCTVYVTGTITAKIVY